MPRGSCLFKSSGDLYLVDFKLNLLSIYMHHTQRKCPFTVSFPYPWQKGLSETGSKDILDSAPLSRSMLHPNESHTPCIVLLYPWKFLSKFS